MGELFKSKTGENQGTEHCISRCENFAHLISRCEFLGPKGAIFAHPKTSHLPSFRPWQRPEEAFPPPHPHRPSTTASRHGSAASPPVQAPAIPPSEGEPLLSADTPPGGHPRTCATSRPSQSLFLGPLRREPSSRVLESHPTPQQSRPTEEPRIPVGFLPRPGPQTAARAQRFIPTAAEASAILLIQFTIDGRQGAIGARHIAEALRIPYEPVIQADFREWSSFSQSDMVRILSRGTSTASVLTRRELPSGMLLIDVLLRANIPLQHKFRGESYT
ncbi:hypothetical protein CK203_079710 [Vitis vinifera]|uniref:Uncharacterized protein n=1 Tax=Vitis vinifera TaxID=29760 RepID=A0A438DL65_VITVI|nr:hypothetical protein CK203_115076 [Vitis vinifera]RVW36149.1 hypothetical protein CK203_079710 [Vitis vinifera]